MLRFEPLDEEERLELIKLGTFALLQLFRTYPIVFSYKEEDKPKRKKRYSRE